MAINELADCKTIAHLTRYDSTHGRFPGEVAVSDDTLQLNGHDIRILHCEQIEQLPWAELGVDMVLECTGAFSDRQTAQKHIDQGAGRVLFSQPANADVDATIVYGFNHRDLTPHHTIVSNASSCTTNCSIPVIKALQDSFGVESAALSPRFTLR